MSKHTPGPWWVDENATALHVDCNFGEIAAFHRSTLGIKNGNALEATTRANARLIAAAPDLLLVAKKAHALLFNGIKQDLVAELQSAIIKAEGKS